MQDGKRTPAAELKKDAARMQEIRRLMLMLPGIQPKVRLIFLEDRS